MTEAHIVSDGDLEAFLATPQLEQIETLSITFSGAGARTSPASLFDAKRFRSLVDLRFIWDALNTPPLPELVASPLVANVERFTFRWHEGIEGPTDFGGFVERIVKSRLRERLVHLSLACQRAGKGIDAFGKATWPRLRSIEWRCDDTGDAILPIAKARTLANLEAARFVMDPNAGTIRPADAIALVRALPKLSTLALEGEFELAIRKLVSLRDMARMHELSFRTSGIGDAGAFAIAKATHLAKLRVLDLASTKITSTGATALRNAPHLASLRHLDLSGNKLFER